MYNVEQDRSSSVWGKAKCGILGGGGRGHNTTIKFLKPRLFTYEANSLQQLVHGNSAYHFTKTKQLKCKY